MFASVVELANAKQWNIDQEKKAAELAARMLRKRQAAERKAAEAAAALAAAEAAAAEEARAFDRIQESIHILSISTVATSVASTYEEDRKMALKTLSAVIGTDNDFSRRSFAVKNGVLERLVDAATSAELALVRSRPNARLGGAVARQRGPSSQTRSARQRVAFRAGCGLSPVDAHCARRGRQCRWRPLGQRGSGTPGPI